MSEKLILTVPDLCQLLIYGVSWPYGHELHCLQDLKDSDETMIKTGGIADDIGQAFVPSNRGLYLEDVEKARQETGEEIILEGYKTEWLASQRTSFCIVDVLVEEVGEGSVP